MAEQKKREKFWAWCGGVIDGIIAFSIIDWFMER